MAAESGAVQRNKQCAQQYRAAPIAFYEKGEPFLAAKEQLPFDIS